MASVSWRKGRFLSDEELLEAAELAAIELEQLPLDNNILTDEEDSDNEWNDNDITGDVIQKLTQHSKLPQNNFLEITEDENTIENNIQEHEKSKIKSKISQEEVNRKWKKKEISKTMPSYSLPEGPVEEHFLQCRTFADYFLKVLGSTIIDNIIYQSNLYATQRDKILNLKENELIAFIGINFFMGYHSLPSYKHYWATAEDLGVPIVIRTMPRNRFQQIVSFLHINDNSTIPRENKDKLYKIRPFVTSLNNQFDLLYHGTRELSVDESIILFKGRSTIKQYNPMKPIKRGYKLWCIADKLGYVKKFDIYQGKNETAEQKFQYYGLGERVVLSLTENYWGTHRTIYFDNYFTTVQLLEKLKSENTLACGTIRSNRRGLPKDMTNDKNMERGDYDYRVSNLDIIFFKWCDNRSVYLLSNFHGSQSSYVKRLQKDGTQKEIACPAIIPDYNSCMGGVDIADRLRAAYCTDRRSKKWWHRIFFGLLDIAFVNSYIIYKKLNPEEHISLLDFRRGVSTGLMMYSNACVTSGKKRNCAITSACSSPHTRDRNSPVNPPKRRKYNYSVPSDVRLGNRGAHWPIFGKERRRCEQCSSMGIESRPHSKCSGCGVYLCINEKKKCFLVYHEISQ